MTIVKLKAGETVLVSAVKSGEAPDQGLPPPGGAPVDPGYGIDVGLGWLRPTHPIAPGGRPPGTPTHPIELPPAGPVDPAWGIDEDIGYVRPEHPIALPPPAEIPGWEVKVAWTPVTGWIVVAIPSDEHPTPSKRK